MTWNWFIFALVIAFFGMYLLRHSEGSCCGGHARPVKTRSKAATDEAESPENDNRHLACH